MTQADDVEIAGRVRASDWWRARETLTVGGDPDTWSAVFERFFQKRMQTRYLAPIRAIQDLHTGDGEGFSMVALQCTLIEFLAAVRIGKTHRAVPKETLGEHEYNDSKKLFVSFLRTQTPFCDAFATNRQALDFYVSVRCGLLHEARTKGRWRIHQSGDRSIDAAKGIVYRDTLQNDLEAYIASYGLSLRDDRDLQKGFLRKFDVLAGPKSE